MEESNGAIELVRVLTGISKPSFATSPPDDDARLFILERQVGMAGTTGTIRILSLADDTLVAAPFLSLTVSAGREQGLLGLAFHPDYADNGHFFVYYTDAAGDTTVERYTRSPGDPNLADAGSARLILKLDQPQNNHNGGWLGFGPDDGYLYIALGDGGGGNDINPGHTPGVGNSQDTTDNLLGSLLRVDVDGADAYPTDDDRNYAIPATNPFVGIEGDDEIWAFGLRNPWRASFDRETFDLYLGDVGQNTWEELNVQPAGSLGGENYGWRLREGIEQTPTPPVAPVGGPRPDGAIEPIFVYGHDTGSYRGCSITGGYVYRGPIESLDGLYFFADFCGANIASLRFDGSNPVDFDGENYSEFRDRSEDPGFIPEEVSLDSVTSFGEDAVGNLYVLDDDGDVFRLQSTPNDE